MSDAGLFPPVQQPLDPNLYPQYIDTMRKQQLAQLLMGTAQQSAQTPAEWNSMRVVPKRSPLANVATLASALMAGKALGSANEGSQNYYQKLMGMAPSAPNPSPGPAPSAAPQEAPPEPPPLIRNPGYVSPPPAAAQPPQPAQPQPAQPSSMLLPGTDMATSQRLFTLLGPQKYGEVLAAQYQPTEMEKMLRAAGVTDPAITGPILQGAIAKANYIAPIGGARPGTIAHEAITNRPLFAQPDIGRNVNLAVDASGGVSASPITGNPEAQAELEQAQATAKTKGSMVQAPQRGGGTVPMLGSEYLSHAPSTQAAAAASPPLASLPTKVANQPGDYWAGLPTWRSPTGGGAQTTEEAKTAELIPQLRSEKFAQYASQAKDAGEQERNDIMALRNLGNATVGPEADRVNAIKGTLNQFGLLSQEQADKLTSSTELGKYLNNNALANARQKFGGGRLTNTDVTLSIEKLNPGTNMTDKAIFNLSVENMIRSAYAQQAASDFTLASRTRSADPQTFEQWYSRTHSLNDFANQHGNAIAQQAAAEWKGGTASVFAAPVTATGPNGQRLRLQGGQWVPHAP